MTVEQLIQLEDGRWEERKRLLREKGASYSGEEDTLANFKRIALLTRSTPERVLGIYAAKHWDAIQTWIDSKQESEPIQERIDDLQNYLGLLRGLIVEDK